MKQCKICLKSKPLDQFRIVFKYKNKHYRETHCNNCYNQRSKDRNWLIKLEGINEYGGQCACCGETTIHFLTIDHINGRDKGEKRKTGSNLWRNLRKLGWPKENIQLLCFNCNCAKGAYGMCPHQENK